MSVEVITLGVAIIAQVIGIAYMYGKLTQKQEEQAKKLDDFINSQEVHRISLQDAMDDIWSSMSSRFEKIFDNYLKTEDAEKFFKKKGDK